VKTNEHGRSKIEDGRLRPEAGSKRPEAGSPKPEDSKAPSETCDYCGAEALTWRKCKLICGNCGNIVKSCADL
jgi:hypothetical protein